MKPRLLKIEGPLCHSRRSGLWLEMKLINHDQVIMRMTVSRCEVPLRWHAAGLIQGVLFEDGRPIGYATFRPGRGDDVNEVLSPKFAPVGSEPQWAGIPVEGTDHLCRLGERPRP